jgi:acyl-CoA reductase-like NAD-dependent aldehyde dehydrogenase
MAGDICINISSKIMQMTKQRLNQAALDFIERGGKKLLIDNKWVDAVTGETIDVINPANEEVLCTVAVASAADVDLAVSAARRAFESESWASITPYQRESYLNSIADLIEAHSEELATLDSLDNGMTLFNSQFSVTAAIHTFRYYSGWPTKVYGKTNPGDIGSFTYTLREPIGVCGAIIPWNGPFMFAAWKIAPAIAFGNTIVIKPSEITPLSILRLGELIIEAGLPAGVVNIVPGYGHTAGEAIIHHRDIDKIAFTGSTAVGRKIIEASAGTMKKVTVELGGKSPFIIFPDADLDSAIQTAVIGFTGNSGQACTAGTRIFVHKDIYEVVAGRISEAIQQLKIGNGTDATTQMGPITNKQQFEKIRAYVEIGKQEGATLLTGGERVGGKGYFIAPALFTNVTNNMRIAQEEIFGPVAVLIPFSEESEVVNLSNDTPYGLAASIWTRDLNRAHRISKAIKAGTVWINTIFEMDPIFPFGGFKQSGLGKELGEESVDAYTQIKSVVLRF